MVVECSLACTLVAVACIAVFGTAPPPLRGVWRAERDPTAADCELTIEFHPPPPSPSASPNVLAQRFLAPFERLTAPLNGPEKAPFRWSSGGATCPAPHTFAGVWTVDALGTLTLVPDDAVAVAAARDPLCADAAQRHAIRFAYTLNGSRQALLLRRQFEDATAESPTDSQTLSCGEGQERWPFAVPLDFAVELFRDASPPPSAL